VVQHKDAVRPGAGLTLSILDGIREADLIIADVSEQNPNVMYELGFAHALRKPAIHLINIKSSTGIPSDLEGLDYVVYDPADFRRLTDIVRSVTRTMLARRA
jgi:nucleoside 2-deoxyribosyltransferase